MASPTVVEGTVAAPVWKPRPLLFTDLPPELQKDIISHVPQTDLVCLILANKHFRELATAELYRSFHIVFPDDDDPAYDSPVDGLANGLETFATSDYDHAKHLREVTLDTVSAGEKAEIAYKQYLANNSCGKFMNVLFLLVVRKAKALEKLNWNIRVELSRPLYKALHNIETLQHVHIRLQAGPSLYEVPPPLPLYSPSLSPGSSTLSLPLVNNHLSPHTVLSISHTGPAYIHYPSSSMPPLPPSSKSLKSKAQKKNIAAKSPPTLSGFKNLKSLAILDIDDLEVVTELKQCIRRSEGTLNKLKLSFSTALATRARKPAPELDPDDSDPDDEFQVVPVSTATTSYDDISGPAKVFRAQEEKKTQEAVLGRIFDVEPTLVEKCTGSRRAREKESEASKSGSTAAPASDFINSLKAVSSKLMKELNGSEDFTASQQEILDTIEAAARKYVSAEQKKTDSKKEQENGGSSATVTKHDDAVAKDEEVAPNKNESAETDAPNEEQDETSLFEEKAAKSKDTEKGSSPDDIDIEAPVEDMPEDDDTEAANGANDSLLTESPAPADETMTGAIGLDSVVTKGDATNSDATNSDATNSDAANSDATKADASSADATTSDTTKSDATTEESRNEEANPANSNASVTLAAQEANFKTLGHKLRFLEVEAAQLQKEVNETDLTAGPESMKKFENAERQLAAVSDSIKEIMHEMSVAAAEIQDVEKQTGTKSKDEDVRQRIREYTRSTRGLSLHTLSIYLIPLKASVLLRAIDLRCLKKLTLLNVDNQSPVWTRLAKENKAQELPLRMIFTDNVSVKFLTLVSQLREVEELYMLERSDKYKPESFAPKSTVTIDQIRRFALKKHQGSIKRLMIKNQNDMSWDLDTKTTALLSRFKLLEELAVSMSIREVHTLLQNIHLMVNLRALHIVNLRNDDTCVWVMRETKRFIIDNLCHFPALKLEWLAIDEDEHAERLVRWKSPPKDKKKANANAKGKGKGKENGKQKGALSVATNGEQYPLLSLEPGIDSDSDDDADDDLSHGTIRIETIENIHFYDVWDVGIFKRTVVSGRL